MMCAGWVGFNASEQAEKPHPSERYKICKRNKTMTLTQGYFPHTDTDGGREGWWAVSHLTPQGPQNRRRRGEWGMGFSFSWLNDSVWLQATLLAAGNSFSGWPTRGFKQLFVSMRECAFSFGGGGWEGNPIREQTFNGFFSFLMSDTPV